MVTVTTKHKNERFDSLFRRFNRAVDRENVIREARQREFYEKPSIKRKRARAAARKRSLRDYESSKLSNKRKF